MDLVNRGGQVRRAWGGMWEGSQWRVLSYIVTEKQPWCDNESTERGTVCLSGRDGRWQQFHTKCTYMYPY